MRILPSITLCHECFNAVGVAVLIAQGCQTIVQATWVRVCCAWNNAIGVTLFRSKLPLIQVYIDINHVIKCTFQRRRCCAFDSPGLPNDSAGYPGLTYVVRGTPP